MKKVLFVATVVRLHINMFHQPFIKWFHDQGWQVDVAANNDYEDPSECVIPYCDNFHLIPFERKPLKKNNITAYRELKKLIDSNEYDIIHCHTPMGSVLARLAARKVRKNGKTKVIYTAHGFHFYKGAPLMNRMVYYPVEKRMARHTDLLITMNSEDYEAAKKFRAGRVACVHGVGIDLTKFDSARMTPEEKNGVRTSLGLKENDIFAISVAQLIPRKNHMVLIRAAARLGDPAFHLFICGDGAQESELREEIKRLGVEDRVHLLGFRRDIYRLCGAADLFMFGSIQEGLPVAVMEAMACGLPIIASKIRGNVDLIDSGKGGFLVPADDADAYAEAIRTVLEGKADLNAMKEYNLRKVAAYGIPEVVREMAALYTAYM